MGFHLPICELWNFVYCILYFIGKTSRQFMVGKFSFVESSIALCKINYY